jgi:hypothetical protein
MRDDKDILNSIDTKLDELKDKVHNLELSQLKALGEVHSVLKDQHTNLELHMKRSDALEEQVAIMEQKVEPILSSVYTVVKSIKFLIKMLSVASGFILLYFRIKKP